MKSFILFSFLFSSLIAQNISELIQPLKLVSGKEKSIVVSDLFYSESYDLSFAESDQLQLSFSKTGNQLNVKAKDGFEGIASIQFSLNNEVYDVPVYSIKEKLYEFTFRPDKEYAEISLFGSFNGWNRKELFMSDENGDGVFTTSVSLEPGVYQYKFFADGIEIVDPENTEKVPNGFGDFNSIRVINEDQANKYFLHVDRFIDGEQNSEFVFDLENSGKHHTANANSVFAFIDNKKVDTDKIRVDKNKIRISLSKSELLDQNFLRVVYSENGKISNMQNVLIENEIPAYGDNFSWYDGIIYSIMIDRFNDGDKSINFGVSHDSLSSKANYMGGDLQGVIDKLEDGYFDSLGINTIWISPVMDNPNTAFKEYPAPHRYYSGYHGYWPIHPERVEENFGNLETLKKLVSTAQERGIKILLDFVSNHVHQEHPYFHNNREWFGKLELPDGRLNLRFWDEYRLTTWFEPYLPSFDYEGSLEAVETMTDNAVWWLKKTGADGYRHDAVKHVPNLFWRSLTAKLKQEVEILMNKKLYQIGETFGSYDLISSYVNNGQLNSQFNFNLYDVALPTFINPKASFSGLSKEMQKTFSVYGGIHLMGNVMDSHDKNRFMAFADDDLNVSQWSAIDEGWNNPPLVDNHENYKKLILYMAYMNTIPGLPVIYYGSEFGMTGASDPDNRRMMRFGNDLTSDETATLNSVREIITLRKNHSALRYGDFYTLTADENIFAYLRSDFNEKLLIVINKSDAAQQLELILPEVIDSKTAVSLRDMSVISLNSDVKLNCPPMSWNIYKID
ncbi:MAG: hypothetical protein KKG93_17385 [Bacteroidetes bacterium]|nr:hypothetical protein [Bacteroidota bacterium]